MASLNESLYSSPTAKRALKLQSRRLQIAENVRKRAGRSGMTYEQQLVTAMTLENTAKQLKVMEALNPSSATQASSIGQYKRFAMDMVGTIIPSLIAPEVVSTQALDNRVGMINVLEYQYGTDKGSAVAGQTFASPLGYQGMNLSYTSSSIDGEIIPSSVTGNYEPEFGPIKGTVKVVTEGTVTDVTPNGNGELPEGSFTAGVSKIYYIYDNETVPVTAPQIKIDIKSIPIETKARKLTAIWAFDAQYELAKEYGQDMQQLLTTQATAEIAQEIDNEITLDLYRIANAGPEISWSRTQPVGVNIVDHYDSFWNKIVEGSNQIYGATKRARANFMICGLGVDAVLKTMRNFAGSEDMTSVGPHFIGTLGGSIRCYVNPNYGPNEFVLGYKGSTFMDAGYVYAPYLPVTTTGMVTLADDFAAREGWATLYGKKAINPRLYVKGHIDG